MKKIPGLTANLMFAVVAASLGSGFQHGYNTGVINNPQKILEEWTASVLKTRTGEQPAKSTVTLIYSISVSIFCVGGMIGGLITGLVADKLGRKKGLMYNNVFVVLACVLQGLAKQIHSVEMYIIGRLLIGVNSGLNAGLCPMYLSEIAPVSLRGALGSMYQLVITISILLAQIFSSKNVLGTNDMWPLLFILNLIPAAIQIVAMLFCAESPRFLLASKGNEDATSKALRWFRNTDDIGEEMGAMKSEVEKIKSEPAVKVKDLFVTSALRQPLIIALAIMLAQQFCGINAVIFYSTDIFKMSKMDDDQAEYATIGIGVVNVLMTVVSLVLVEIAGRKTLLLFGFVGITVVTFVFALGLIFQKSVPMLSYVCIALLFIYIIVFASGPGSIPWFLVTELFNQSARPTAASLAVFTNWFANTIVGLSFLPVKSIMGAYVFFIFVGLDVLFTVFIFIKVPETKNKPIEEISAMFT